MINVKRLGHATLATPDIERQSDYWTAVMGLRIVNRNKDCVLLATKLGQEVIALESGREAFLTRLSFQVAPGSDLGEVSAALQKLGVSGEPTRFRDALMAALRESCAVAVANRGGVR